MKEKCPYCNSENTGDTSPEHLDVMRDHFCYDCCKDFYSAEDRAKYENK